MTNNNYATVLLDAVAVAIFRQLKILKPFIASALFIKVHIVQLHQLCVTSIGFVYWFQVLSYKLLFVTSVGLVYWFQVLSYELLAMKCWVGLSILGSQLL